MLNINADRLLGDLHRLRTFGAYKTGVHRPTYSDVDMAARSWTAERMREAGLTATIDGIGNVWGRSDAPGPVLLVGSHVESQPYAGWLDGALGVAYALEIARSLQEMPWRGRTGVDVVAFADEEGHFGSFHGSRSACGLLDEADIDTARNRYDGTPLRAALERAGLAGRERQMIDPARCRGYLEAHIEQGDELESTGRKIGIVTRMVGTWQYRIDFTGEANHAGTTRMSRRRDAGQACIRFASEIATLFPRVAGPRTVWTIGNVRFEPGAASIIPGRAHMLFQFRDPDPGQLSRLGDALEGLVERSNREGPCRTELQTLAQSTPTSMDEGLQDTIEQAAEHHCPGLHQRMPSGAGHDGQWLARKVPAAMLFVPSIGGVSHHWTEDTAEEDIVLGARVLADATAIALTRLDRDEENAEMDEKQ